MARAEREAWKGMPEEFVYEVREKATSVTIKDFTPEGVRLSYNLQGLVKGQYDAARVESANALLRPDGSGDIEIRIMDRTAEGEVILIPGKGTVKAVGPKVFHVEGTNTFMTTSKRMAWLNPAKGRFEGTFDMSTGEAVVKCFATR